jgi:hypothetical protein
MKRELKKTLSLKPFIFRSIIEQCTPRNTSRQYSGSPTIAFQLVFTEEGSHTWKAVMDEIEGSALSGAQKWNQISK